MGRWIIKKRDPEFMERLAECGRLDEETGGVRFEGMYVAAHFYFKEKNGAFAVPCSHVVWFLKHGRWPKDGYQLDHINDDSLDNRPANLQEMTKEDNQAKRRGRLVYRSYGKGRYGYGFGMYHDGRDDRYYIGRNLSRGLAKTYTKKTGVFLGGYDTKEEAEAKIAEYIEDVKKYGMDYMPPPKEKKPSYRSVALREQREQIREMRIAGKTLHEISEITGLSQGALCGITKDLGIDRRHDNVGPKNKATKLNPDMVREIRALRAQGMYLMDIATKFKISRGAVYSALDGERWAHVT